MDSIIEVAKYVIPALIVFGAAYFTLLLVLQKDEQKRKVEVILGNQKLVTPIRLQAYERVVLYLERIAPESLVIRTKEPNMTNKQLHLALLNTIRTEFEHNLSQQIYMTNESWLALKMAKESVSQLVNVAASRVVPEEPAIILTKTIIDMYSSIEEPPINSAVNLIKKEVIHLLGVPYTETEE